MRRTLLFFGLWLAVSTRVAGAAEPTPSWVELAANGGLSVRAIVAGACCPACGADGGGVTVQRRGAPASNFPHYGCQPRGPGDPVLRTGGDGYVPVLPPRG